MLEILLDLAETALDALSDLCEWCACMHGGEDGE